MDLSIVITTYNRSAVLERLLHSLGSQNDRDFEVVVAIDGSTDNTELMLRGLTLPFECRWVNTHCRTYGLAVARNRGILAARGTTIVLLDDDSFPEPGLVSAHKSSAMPGVITGGPRKPAESGNERMLWKMRELARLPERTPISLSTLRREWPKAYLVENNISMLRQDFIDMGLFSERLKMYGFIGQEFFGRAEFLGLRYQFDPCASIVHHGELAGNNGLDLRRKRRQIFLSSLIRPTLMTPKHYDAQVNWARALSSGIPASLPSFRLQATLAAPFRIAAQIASRLRRVLRKAV